MNKGVQLTTLLLAAGGHNMKNLKYIDTLALTNEEARDLEKNGKILEYVTMLEFKTIYKIYKKED